MIRKWLLAAAAILGLAPSPPAYSDTVVSGGRVVFGNDFFVNPAGPQGPTVHLKRPGNAQAWTPGSVIFAYSANELGEDNATFFWNRTTKRLGIGLQPSYELDIRTTVGSSTVLRMGAGIGGHNRIVLGEGRTGNGYAYIDLVGDTTYVNYGLRVLRDLGGPNTGSYISHSGTGTFYIGGDQASALALLTSGLGRVTVAAGGHVVIGPTLSASAQLQVTADITTALQLNNSNFNPTLTGSSLSLGFGAVTGNTYSVINALSSGNYAWSNLILQEYAPAGLVGIGTTAPTQKLHVEGVVIANNGYFITQGTSANYNFYDRDLGGGNSQLYRQSGVSILWDSVAGNVMSYTNAGLVGINTTAPLHALDVRAPGPDTYVYFGAGRTGSNGLWVGKSRTSGNGYAYLDLVGDMTYTDYGLRAIRNNTGPDTTSQILHRGLGEFQLYTVDAGAINFVTNSVGRMRIEAGGSVGIGTDSIYPLQIRAAPDHNLIFWNNGGRSGIGNLNNLRNAWQPMSINPGGNIYMSETTGSVAIGSITPFGRLHIYAPDGYQLRLVGLTMGLRFGTDTNGSFIQGVDNLGGGSTWQPFYLSGSTVTIGASGGGTMYVNANGNLGIHTTRNLARLSFGSPGINDNIIHLWDDGTNRYGWGMRGGQKLDYAADNASLTWGHMSPSGVYTQRTAIDIYGNFLVNNGQFYSGYSQLNNEALEACVNRPSDGYCYVDLHSQPGTDFNFRMFRNAGVDGAADFTNNGAGAINFYQYFGRLPLQIVGGRVVINTDLGPALSVADAGGLDNGNYGTVNITRGATDGSRAHLAFIRNGNAVMQFGYFPNSNDFGIWPGGYPGETVVRLSSGGMTLGVAPIVSNKGGLSVGDGNRNWNPNDGTTGWGATFLLTGLDVTSIGFHDGSCCLGWIRYTANNFTIGYDYGWGSSTVYFGGWVTTNGGLTAVGSFVSTNGMDFYDRTNTATGYSALFRSGGVSRLWNNTSGDVIAYGANGNVAMGNLQFGVSKLYVKSGDTDNILYASGDSAAVRLGASGGWGKVGATDTVASVWLPLIISGSHVLFGIQGVENARVDSNGNFGIGYSAPGHKLEVNGNGYFNSTLESVNTLYSYNELRVTNAAFIGANGLYVNGYRTTYADASWVQIFDTVGRGGFYLGNGTTYMRNYQLYFDDHGGTNFADVNSGGWKFNIDAKLANNRRVGSFDTTGNYRNLIMVGSDNTMYLGDASYGFTQFNAGSTIHVSTTIMRVYAGSQFEVMNYNAYKNGGGSWLDNSDIRTKKEVFDYRVGLSEILRLRPVVYKHNGKYDTADNDERYVGFVADEVRKHMPEMVGFRYAKENPDSADYTKILTIDMTALPLALVNSVKELEARIKALETPGGRPTPQ